VAVGENARPAAAQDLNTVLGKMLRINKDVPRIPDDNPFYAQTTGNNRAIWALGLRNPYSFDVQPNTGRIFINDVGQNAWEEINEGIAGANYGWPIYEGPVNYTASKSKNAASKSKKRHKGRHKHRHKQRHKPSYDNTSPLLYAYPHSVGCAITGGAFYNPQTVQPPFPADYVGDYFFADFCGGWISNFDPATKTVTGFKSASSEQPVDLKVSTEGDLYFLARGTGSIEKISYTP
jgi:glucose/arabinose dehydrogenase